MKDWQQRVIDEADALNVKGEKLADFVDPKNAVYAALDFDEQVILISQLAYMGAYASALEERIDMFENSKS